MAAKHRFEILLFWSLDRLTREGTFKTHCYLKELTDAGVKFKSFTEQYVDSLGVFGDAIIGLLAAMAPPGTHTDQRQDKGGHRSTEGSRQGVEAWAES